jgi:SAM-dependent methyltransferase
VKTVTKFDNFINLKLTGKVIDIYGVRKAILEALRMSLPLLKGVLLDVGCGDMPYKSLLLSEHSRVTKYIGLDLAVNPIYSNVRPDLTWDGESIPSANESVDCAIATELFEHCPSPEIVMREINRVLKPGGSLFFTVPFLWPLHDVPYDQYRYTPFSLERHLKNSGFQTVEIKALGGWDASLAQMIGLWVNRRPLSYLKRKLLQYLTLPLIGLLVRNDTRPDKFDENAMSTGYFGIACKNSDNSFRRGTP